MGTSIHKSTILITEGGSYPTTVLRVALGVAKRISETRTFQNRMHECLKNCLRGRKKYARSEDRTHDLRITHAKRDQTQI